MNEASQFFGRFFALLEIFAYLISICAFDPFGYGLRRYQFHRYEDSIRDLRFDTHSHELFINSKGTKGEISNDLVGVIDLMNQKPNQTNLLANKLKKEIDYYNHNSEKRRERGLVLFPVANTLLI